MAIDNKLKQKLSDHKIFPIYAFLLYTLFILVVMLVNYEKLLAYVPDDAFYYFKIAQNMIAGQSFSFDNINKTNGVHPLWLFIITPITFLFGDNFVPILIVGALFFALGSVILVKLVENLFGRRTSLLFSIMLSLNPMAFLMAINGLETGLHYFFMALVLYLFINYDIQSDYRKLILAAAASGLLFLSRTDSALLLIILAVYFLVTFRGNIGELLLKSGVAGAVFGVVVGGWLFFCAVRFGSIIQESGTALTYLLAAERAYTEPNHHIASKIAAIIQSNIIRWNAYSGFKGARWPLVVLSLTFAALFAIKKPDRKQVVFVLVSFSYLALVIVISAVRLSPRLWYFAPFIYIGVFLCAYILDRSIPEGQAMGRIAALVIALIILYINYGNIRTGFTPRQLLSKAKLEHYNAYFQPGEVVGCTDAGVMGYFSNFTMVNLDGLVNSSIVPYVKQGRVYDYLSKNKMQNNMIRPVWLKPWYMGIGTGLLYYLDEVSSPIDSTVKLQITRLINDPGVLCEKYYREQIKVSADDIEKFLAEGWPIPAIPEDDLIWMNEDEAFLTLPLCKDVDYRIDLRLGAYANPIGDFIASFEVNGTPAGKYRVAPGEAQSYTIYASPPYPLVSRIKISTDRSYSYPLPQRSALKRKVYPRSLALSSIAIQEIPNAEDRTVNSTR